ncbi:hypothetical protein ACFPZL_03630 [Leucobacter soli]|uniref:Bacteriocin biosynthesis cyclodehydratase domain-containing protein n=1 Tax=Leucobacter soli TaxID=2812850 RepID=A0A916JTP6_9MICO|nr:hypothetical protein [Leucobacter soli]CAG7601355.1 hypothetical protein LEUCIP111803_00453 [Leucobacter soli]
MPPTITRIDPDLPLCWEDERTLRLGFERAEVRIDRPSATVQRLLGALQTGIRSDRLEETLCRLGATPMDWLDLVGRLETALRHLPVGGPRALSTSPPARLDVLTTGPQHLATHFREACVRAGFGSAHDSNPSATLDPAPGSLAPTYQRFRRPGLVIAIERYLAPSFGTDPPPPKGPPRLLVRFTDRSILVGPLISDPADPCAACIQLGDTDADPALPVLAAQLLGEIPASETTACAETAAAQAVALVRRWRAGHESLGRVRYRIPVQDGLPLHRIEAEPVEPHRECGCALERTGSSNPAITASTPIDAIRPVHPAHEAAPAVTARTITRLPL